MTELDRLDPTATDAPRRRRPRARQPTARALEKEQEIYDVAADILHKKGYAATTLQDIASAVVYLTDARQITGEVLRVDGGAHLGKW